MIYNEQGNIVRIDDYTRPDFTFTIQQLTDKILNEFNIDLYNKDGWSIQPQTWNEDGIMHYEWWVVGHEIDPVDRIQVRRTYRVDGKTGELLGIEEGDYGAVNQH